MLPDRIADDEAIRIADAIAVPDWQRAEARYADHVAMIDAARASLMSEAS
jgi:hypothetical protein